MRPSELLGPEGPFARLLPGFSPRPQQQAMADAVADAIDGASLLLSEAGTGVGKTFAYLLPALRSGRKIIISTGTRNLQDQLFGKDLPLVREALGSSVRSALLKGRANYLCLHRLQVAEQAHAHGSGLAADLVRVREWSRHTLTGDVSTLPLIAEDSPVWPQVTSTVDNCLGSDCDHYDECHVLHARRAAQEADVVVVNHHLLCADMALREEGFGEILPAADAFIIDEAHQLPEVAGTFFGISLSARQVLDLVRDSRNEYYREAGDMPDLPAAADRLERAVLDLRLALGDRPRRAAWHEVEKSEPVRNAMAALEDALLGLGGQLEAASGRGKGLDSCHQRVLTLLERYALVTAGGDDGYIHWFETFSRSFALYLTPLSVADTFRGWIESHHAAWVFTSATLSVGGRFDHFARQLGLEEAATQCLDSPFDYRNNALLYLPPSMPDPNQEGYTRAVVESALPVLAASGGRAFLLFTSYRALREAEELLWERSAFPLLVQGSMPRAQLLERFRALDNAVLLGTSSFWEGVDVRGEALSCVIIDRLPFASPGDPVLQARMQALRAAGQEPFRDFQLPRAVIALRQGVGRLIRDVHDRGVLMLCDPRLTRMSYGRVFLRSLPPMPVTRDVGDVERFFRGDAPVY